MEERSSNNKDLQQNLPVLKISEKGNKTLRVNLERLIQVNKEHINTEWGTYFQRLVQSNICYLGNVS